METFSSVDLQKRTGEVQRAASRGPVAITVHGTPRTVMLPIEQFEGLTAEASSRVPAMSAALINEHIDRFTPHEAQRIVDRAAVAAARAERALAALDILGIKAWVTGSLARGSFNVNSDVDFVVDIPPGRKHMVFLIIEEAMGDMSFDLVPFDQIPENDRILFMHGALDASGFRSRFAKT